MMTGLSFLGEPSLYTGTSERNPVMPTQELDLFQNGQDMLWIWIKLCGLHGFAL